MTGLLLRLRSPRGAALAAAALVTLAGVLLVLLGLARATVWAPEALTVARVQGQAGAPLVVTTPALTTLDGPSLQVDVTGPAGQQVFVGVGRADDVAAYLGSAARTEVTGIDGDRGETRKTGTESTLPEPAGVDVWAAEATGPGRAGLVWKQQPGRWQVVAAVDGSAPPDEVVLTWTRARGSSSAPALIAVGGLLLALGLVGGWAARRRLAPAALPAPAAAVDVADRLAGAARPADPAATPAPGTRRAARLGSTGEVPVVRGASPWSDAGAADPDDEPERDAEPAPFRQPPGGAA